MSTDDIDIHNKTLEDSSKSIGEGDIGNKTLEDTSKLMDAVDVCNKQLEDTSKPMDEGDCNNSTIENTSKTMDEGDFSNSTLEDTSKPMDEGHIGNNVVEVSSKLIDEEDLWNNMFEDTSKPMDKEDICSNALEDASKLIDEWDICSTTLEDASKLTDEWDICSNTIEGASKPINEGHFCKNTLKDTSKSVEDEGKVEPHGDHSSKDTISQQSPPNEDDNDILQGQVQCSAEQAEELQVATILRSESSPDGSNEPQPIIHDQDQLIRTPKQDLIAATVPLLSSPNPEKCSTIPEPKVTFEIDSSPSTPESKQVHFSAATLVDKDSSWEDTQSVNSDQNPLAVILRNKSKSRLPKRSDTQTKPRMLFSKSRGVEKHTINGSKLVFPIDELKRNFESTSSTQGAYSINNYHLPTSNLPSQFRLDSSSSSLQISHKQVMTQLESGNGRILSSFMKAQRTKWQQHQNQMSLHQNQPATTVFGVKENQFQGLLQQHQGLGSTSSSSFFPMSGGDMNFNQNQFQNNVPTEEQEIIGNFVNAPNAFQFGDQSLLNMRAPTAAMTWQDNIMGPLTPSVQLALPAPPLVQLAPPPAPPTVQLAPPPAPNVWLPPPPSWPSQGYQGPQAYNQFGINMIPNALQYPRVIRNSVYDPMYASMGLPIDPHLRLFVKRRNEGNGLL